MAKRSSGINKTQAVKDYLKDHPDAKSAEIAAALTKKGVDITKSYVANIKTTLNKASKSKTAAKEEATVESAPAPSAKVNGAITLEQIKKVAQTVKAMGGYQRMSELLEVIKETGGVKKFKDLAEAMAPEPDDMTH